MLKKKAYNLISVFLNRVPYKFLPFYFQANQLFI